MNRYQDTAIGPREPSEFTHQEPMHWGEAIFGVILIVAVLAVVGFLTE